MEIAGDGRGIGAAIVRRLAREGAHVALTHAGNSGPANETAKAARALGLQAIAVQADSADAGAVVAAVERTVGELGGMDIHDWQLQRRSHAVRNLRENPGGNDPISGPGGHLDPDLRGGVFRASFLGYGKHRGEALPTDCGWPVPGPQPVRSVGPPSGSPGRIPLDGGAEILLNEHL